MEISYIKRGAVVNTILDVLDTGLGLIWNVSAKISNAVIGDDSGKLVVVIIFYLIALIAILFLLKAFIKIIKAIFIELFFGFGRKNKKAKAGNKDSGPAIPVYPVATTDPVTREIIEHITSLMSFDKEQHLPATEAALDKYKALENNLKQIKHITADVPQALDSEIVEEELTSDEKEFANNKIKGKSLNELIVFLSSAKKEKADLDKKTNSLKERLLKILSEREILAQKERDALTQHNYLVDTLSDFAQNYENNREALANEHTKLSGYISDVEKRAELLLKGIEDAAHSVTVVPDKTNEFIASCEEKVNSFVVEILSKEQTLSSLNNDYCIACESRVTKDAEISSLQSSLIEIIKKKVFQDYLLIVAQAKADELTKAENERLEKEKAERAARLEAERIAREESERLAREGREKAKAAAQAKIAAATKLLETNNNSNDGSSASEEDISKVKDQIKQHSQNAYSLNFENIPPEMLEKMAKAGKKRKIESESTADASNEENTSESTGDQTDYISEIKQQWAAERAHKEEWAAELARKKAEEQRRKEELSEKLSDNGYTDNN